MPPWTLLLLLTGPAAVVAQQIEEPPPIFTSNILPGTIPGSTDILGPLLGCVAIDVMQPCYVKSRDGGDSRTWHELCDMQGPTLTLIKSHKNWIFGGYTNLNWDMVRGYGYDYGAFLFTDQGKSINEGPEVYFDDDGFKMKKFTFLKLPVSRKKLIGAPSDGGGRAIYRTHSSGPRFGSGHDLYIAADMTRGWTTTWDYSPELWWCRPNECYGGGLASSWADWKITELETYLVPKCTSDGVRLPPNGILEIDVNSGPSASVSVALVVGAALVALRLSAA